MPSKVREHSSERRRERKEPSESEKSERKHRHKSSSHRKSSTREKTSSRSSTSPSDPKRRSSMPGVIIEDNGYSYESKSSLPYPSFSKAHSKESVGGNRPNLNILTPPATDLNASKDKPQSSRSAPATNGPPSPPLTDQTAGRLKSTSGKSVPVEPIPEEEKKDDRDNKVKIRIHTKGQRSNGHLRSTSELGPSVSPVKHVSSDRPSTPLKKVDSNVATPQRAVSQPSKLVSPGHVSAAVDAATDSDSTSIAPEQPSVQRPGSRVLQAAAPEIHSQVASIIQVGNSRGPTPLETPLEQASPALSTGQGQHAPPPPPPPPVISVPRVDYLLQHGGLHQTVPRNLLLAGKPMAIQQAALSSGPTPALVANLFEPYNGLLDDYMKVVSKNGSVAVATGYRSVARRLLDRLEAVFARDISSEQCQCQMCEVNNQDDTDAHGVSWGEILELVSGRRELPNWPPFSFVASQVGLGISLEFHAPMQKLDIDVPEEYREHYIRQSRKTKQSVDKWLNRQSDASISPPEDVDDETLTFAILTYLPADQRPTLKDLLGIVDRPIEPPVRAPSPELEKIPKPPATPLPRHRPQYISTAALAIQRLYRLGALPRDPEVAIFLLNNPTLHNTIATLAEISADEWEILISGRFDGFLRSGADDVPDTFHAARQTPHNPKTPSRGPTPGYPNGHSRHSSFSRPSVSAGNQPAQYGAPIAFDEETEIATLAEIERDIYTGMEALEDAFETLHLKAEAVRHALRERSAGLAAAQQRRRNDSGIEVRIGTPASGVGLGDRWDVETDDGLGDWDGISELAPDDSASNISSSRRRRPKRRNERRTPALIEEDEEDGGISEGTESPIKR